MVASVEQQAQSVDVADTGASTTNVTGIIPPSTTSQQQQQQQPVRSTILNEARNLIHSNDESYVKRLAEAVSIASISTELDHRDACHDMANLLHGWIEQLGGKSEKVLVGFQELDDGQRFDLPPVILAEFRDGPARQKKPTLLVYSHYDVKSIDDINGNSINSTNSNNMGWKSNPFVLTEQQHGINNNNNNNNNNNSKTDEQKHQQQMNGNGNSSSSSSTIATTTASNTTTTTTTTTSTNTTTTTTDEKSTVLIGRGVNSSKGPLLAWLWAVEAFREIGAELPVNVKFLIEGMQESHSECVEDLVTREVTNRDGFLSDIDYVVVPSGTWLKSSRPALTYALRGQATFELEIRSATNKQLDAGRYGGIVREPMNDLLIMLGMISNLQNIPGCSSIDIPQISEEEMMLFKSLKIDSEDLQMETGGISQFITNNNDDENNNEEDEDTLIINKSNKDDLNHSSSNTENDGNTTATNTNATVTAVNDTGDNDNDNDNNNDDDDDKEKLDVTNFLLKRTATPSISIHGIEGAYSGSGVRSVIPSCVNGKFSLYYVAGMTIDLEGVESFLRDYFKSLKSNNTLSITSNNCEPWFTNPDCRLFRAGQAAILRTHGIRADLIRDGICISSIPMLQKCMQLKKETEMMLMPITSSNETDVFGMNESILKHRYIDGIYTIFAFIMEIAREHSNNKSENGRNGGFGTMTGGTTTGQTRRKGYLGRLKDIWYGLS